MKTIAYIHPATVSGNQVVAWRITTKDTRIANKMSLKQAKQFALAQGWEAQVVSQCPCECQLENS